MTFTIPGSHAEVGLLTDWVRKNRPASLAVAEEALEGMRRGLPGAYRRADEFLRSMEYRAKKLPPELEPWFWDSVVQGLLLMGGAKCLWAAPRAYAKARQAEADHGLPIDAEHHTGQALFMARRGALPAKEVRAFQK